MDSEWNRRKVIKVKANHKKRIRQSPMWDGRLLSVLGFTKATTDNGSSAIIWDDKLISPDTELAPQNDPKKIQTSETSETPEATNCAHLFPQ